MQPGHFLFVSYFREVGSQEISDSQIGYIHWRLLAGGFEKLTFDSKTMAFTHIPLGDGTTLYPVP